MPGRIQVAAGVLSDRHGRVLITRRAPGSHQGGAWEFPGGKLGPGESPREALERELAEELGIRVQKAACLITVEHDYPDRSVRLHVFQVTRWVGEPRGLENQPLNWLPPQELMGTGLLPADEPIVKLLLSPGE